MDYEALYQELQPLQKDVKDSSNLAQRLFKSISKDIDGGNLRNALKSLDALTQAAAELKERSEALHQAMEQFDEVQYFESGDFAEQMLSCCEEAGIDVIGESPVFEMFPYRLRIDVDNQEVWLDRKKVPTMRPKALVGTIAAGKEKLMKAAFNAQRFADELSDAYDLALLKDGKKRPGSDIYLTSVYKMMVPMSRFKRDYDQNSFAFDIARLYSSDVEKTKNGRCWQFGPSRNNSKAIRILDSEGNEQFLATICFLEGEE